MHISFSFQTLLKSRQSSPKGQDVSLKKKKKNGQGRRKKATTNVIVVPRGSRFSVPLPLCRDTSYRSDLRSAKASLRLFENYIRT